MRGKVAREERGRNRRRKRGEIIGRGKSKYREWCHWRQEMGSKIENITHVGVRSRQSLPQRATGRPMCLSGLRPQHHIVYIPRYGTGRGKGVKE